MLQEPKKFYEDVFSWKIEKWEGPMEYWNITTGSQEEPGINGGLMKKQGGERGIDTPITTYVCTIGVPNIDGYLNKIQEHGGKDGQFVFDWYYILVNYMFILWGKEVQNHNLLTLPVRTKTASSTVLLIKAMLLEMELT